MNDTPNKIVLVGPAYPYRGGLATIIETLCRTFRAMGADASVLTFTLQYPSLLFPGKSQFRSGEAPHDISIIRTLSTVNPLSWVATGRRIRRSGADMVVMKYWTPFMAPAFGTVARVARRGGRTKVIVQLDNITPHERHLFDRPLNRYFLHSADGFIYMSDVVGRDLFSFRPDAPALFSPHPLFDTYGPRTDREEACRRLGLDPSQRYVMFFGYIRDYKGVDLLLDAWALLKAEGGCEGRKLLIVGEIYGDDGRYAAQIERLGLKDDAIMRNSFVPDSDVPLYFSAVDAVALPYRSATQSGVTQVAYAFDVPMIVTRVGGLAEIVPDDVTGLLCDPEPRSIADAIRRACTDGNLERYRSNMAEQKKRFSWRATAEKMFELYAAICGR